MVSRRDYERYQLELIKAEYESKGFSIIEEPRLLSENLFFDAIAINYQSRDAVIIEIINTAQDREPKAHLQQRAERIRDAIAKRYLGGLAHDTGEMRWSVDFRYIDTQKKPDQDRNTSVQSAFSSSSLEKIIAEKLSISSLKSDNPILLNRQFLSDWSITAQTIRAFIQYVIKKEDIEPELSVLDHYNIMLSQFDIVPAEQKEEDNIHDLFDLYEYVQRVISGGQAPLAEVDALRIHLVNLRRQIRHWLKHHQLISQN